MTFTYVPGTPIGLVRQLCTDRDPDHEIFSDEEIEALLDLNNFQSYLSPIQTRFALTHAIRSGCLSILP